MVRLISQVTYNDRVCFVRVSRNLLHQSYSTPLRIEWTDHTRHVAFVSAQTIASDQSKLEIPHLIAKSIGLADGIVCDVTVLFNCVPDVQVFVEPVTVEDWERLELNAATVERELLTQIDVITVNKPFPVYVQGNTICYLQCVEEMKRKNQRGFLRLANDTEVVVSSKVRNIGVDGAKSSVVVDLRVQSECTLLESERNELDSSFIAFVNPETIDILKIKRGNLVVIRTLKDHPHVKIEEMLQEGSGNPSKNLSLVERDGVVVRLVSSNSVLPRHIALSYSLRQYIEVLVACYVSVSTISSQSAILKRDHGKIVLRPLNFISSNLNSLIKLSNTSDTLIDQDLNVKEEFLNFLLNAQINYSALNFELEDSLVPLVQGSIVEIKMHDREDTSWQSSFFEVHFESVKETSKDVSHSSTQVKILNPVSYFLIDPDLIEDSQIEVGMDRVYRKSVFDPLHGEFELSELGGLEKQIDIIKRWLFPALCYTNDYELTPAMLEIMIRSQPSILITGPSGSGKTALSFAIGSFLRKSTDSCAHIIYIPCKSLISEKLRDLEQLFADIVMEAEKHQVTLVIFDDLDKLIPSQSEHDQHHNLRCSKLVENLSDQISETRKHCTRNHNMRISFMATCRDKASLHSDMLLPDLFSVEVGIGIPDSEGRISILKAVICKMNGIQLSDECDLESLQSDLEGYVASDLKTLVDRAIHFHLSSFSNQENANLSILLNSNDFKNAISGFTPTSLKSLKLETSEISWADIGGLNEVQNLLKETLELPSKYSLLFSQIPLKLRSGILLYGPPGCGKTMIASAVAKECGLNFISVKGPELLNKYIGASEQAVRDVFQRASAAAPCVVFFDEFDSIAPRRGGDSTGVTDRVVNQLLCHLDGVENRTGVYVLAASSRPDLIDPALLRPGRLDKSIHCPLPDYEARRSIISVITKKLSIDESIDFDEIAKTTVHYSGADLQGLFTSAQIIAVHDAVNNLKSNSNANSSETNHAQIIIEKKHITQAFSNSRISISEPERLRYEAIHQRISGIQPADPPIHQKVIQK
jgi:peroxin-1